MRRKLRTTLLGAMLSLGICLLPTMTAAATEQTDPAPAESEVPQEDLETGNASESENVIDALINAADEEDQRPANHLEGQCWLTDVNGHMVNRLNAGQTYKFHLKIQVVGDVDAENASAFIFNDLYEKTPLPGYSAEHYSNFQIIYCAQADHVGADCNSITVQSATADPLYIQYVSGTAKLQIPGVEEPIEVDEADLFTFHGVTLGESARDGHLSAGGVTCELTFDIETELYDTSSISTGEPQSSTTTSTTNSDTHPKDESANVVGTTTGQVMVTQTSSDGVTSESSTMPTWQLVLVAVVCGAVGGLVSLTVQFVATSLYRRIKRKDK